VTSLLCRGTSPDQPADQASQRERDDNECNNPASIAATLKRNRVNLGARRHRLKRNN
jgi:hypothetical protein